MNADAGSDRLLGPDELEAELRAIGAERYHHLHPFHKLLHGGKLTRQQVQAWALNRYYYQTMIPIKDAHALSKLPTSELRREWRRRIIDHDGDGPGKGGIERWLKLAEGVGLDRAYVQSTQGILPGTRFAVEAYVNFVTGRSSKALPRRSRKCSRPASSPIGCAACWPAIRSSPRTRWPISPRA